MPNDVRQSIAVEISAELQRQSKTQRDLANVLGLPQSATWLRLHGERPFRAEELPIIAEFLGVPVEQFLRSDAPANTGTAAA